MKDNKFIFNFKEKALNISKNEEKEKTYYIMLENLETSFTSEDYDISTLEKGEDEVFDLGEMTATLTSTEKTKKIRMHLKQI